MTEMRAVPTRLPEVVEIQATRHEDSRGHFVETFRQDWFAAKVADASFVQDNQALNFRRGTIRGLHAQIPPCAQGKLVCCVAGSILDVAVDVRRGSRTFGAWVSVTLSAEQGNQLWVPEGFLHGYCTLSDNCLISYKVTAPYSREHNRGVRWDDPDIGVTWPSVADPTLLSDADRQWPTLGAVSLSFDVVPEH